MFSFKYKFIYIWILKKKVFQMYRFAFNVILFVTSYYECLEKNGSAHATLSPVPPLRKQMRSTFFVVHKIP